MSDTERPRRRDTRTGFLYAAGCFGVWGLVMPVYMKALASVPVLEILSHRVIWASAFAALLITAAGRWREVRAALEGRNLRLLLVSSVLVTANWVTYILAIIHDHLLDTALGYYMNPLVSVALGMIFLGERLRPLQIAACAIAAAGVGLMAATAGTVPWIALTLAFSFGFYGLVRKVVRVEALVGFLVEASMVMPLALGYLLWLAVAGEPAFSRAAPGIDALLLGAGVVTALPLIWFAAAARKLPLSVLGLLQYSSPSFAFLLGILVYGEPFTRAEAVTFACIWLALAVYTVDAMLAQRRAAAALAAGGRAP